MNKKLLFLLTVSLGLVSCKTSNNTSSSNSQSSSSSESTSSSSSSSSSQLPNVDAPKTVTDIYNLIKNTSLKMEITYGRSAERNYVIGQAHLFDDSYETSKEVYHSYSDDVVTVSGEVKYERIPNDEWGEEVLENDTFEGISALVDNYFYQVLDYSNENIHEDSANRYSVPAEVNEQMVDALLCIPSIGPQTAPVLRMTICLALFEDPRNACSFDQRVAYWILNNSIQTF